MKKLGFEHAYDKVRQILDEARKRVYRSINFEMVKAYWLIGKIIVEEEQKRSSNSDYGSLLMDKLSEKLTCNYGPGFNKRNLWYMRSFYLSFKKVNALRSQLSWTHYRQLLKVDNRLAKDFYAIECIKNNWSTRELDRQINSLLYERVALSKDKKGVKELSLKGQKIQQAKDIVKDPYVLEFLDLKENRRYLEKDLEKALINRLQEFMLELGKGFSFVARQKRITVEGDHYYIDLVFYNYILRCFVLFDLKVGKLTHEDIGQMDFYLRYFEKEEKLEGDSPSIGIILCSDKNDTMVRYTLLEKNKSLFASKYKLYLPSKHEIESELNRERLKITIESKTKIKRKTI